VVEQAGAEAMKTETRLLRQLEQVATVPTPVVQFVDAENGCLAESRLPGLPLLHVPEQQRAVWATRVAQQLGRLLSALHESTGAVEEWMPRDATTPAEVLDEARTSYAEVAHAVPAAYRPAVEHFLDAAPPPPAPALRLSHNDLGVEHVLVDPTHGTVTGVVDWSDAAVTDPARDLALLLRDLGPSAYAAALAEVADGLSPHGEDLDALGDRVRCLARCALLEDLAYGVAEDRPAYADKSLRALEWTFVSTP
jgi:aminoglycoside phosphotransferase (APT) family kinase protein